jgi:hypothetical protein
MIAGAALVATGPAVKAALSLESKDKPGKTGLELNSRWVERAPASASELFLQLRIFFGQ